MIEVGTLRMLKFAFVPIAVFMFSPALSSQIYKCVGKDGLDLYQNFPCSMDSAGWLPMDPQKQEVPTSASEASTERAKTVPTKVVGVTAANSLPADGPVVRAGMTTEEVRAVWGEPTGDPLRGLVPILQTEILDGRIQIWTYSPTRAVQFDQSGRVSVIRQ